MFSQALFGPILGDLFDEFLDGLADFPGQRKRRLPPIRVIDARTCVMQHQDHRLIFTGHPPHE